MSRGTLAGNSETCSSILRKPLAGGPYGSALRKWGGEMFSALRQLCAAGRQLAGCPCSYDTGQALDCPLPAAAASGRPVSSIPLSRWSRPRAVLVGDVLPTCVSSAAPSHRDETPWTQNTPGGRVAGQAGRKGKLPQNKAHTLTPISIKSQQSNLK